MPPTAGREAWITGIGLVSSLGEGPDAHWQRLTDPAGVRPVIDDTALAPFPMHPLAPIDLDRQIPKKGDQRQMEPWQRIGTYAAGLALESASLKGNPELLGRTHMIVAAGGGERDVAVDDAVMTGLVGQPEDDGRFLNERLASDLRPTLFLAQLSNLLAGNISIVHGVTGSSRTFMGEESAGVDALRVALKRIEAGQGALFLVGGSFNAERKDLALLYGLGKALWRGPYRPLWTREAEGGGLILGSLGAFLVMEAREHAEARGAKPLARVLDIASGRSRRGPGEAAAKARQLWDSIAPSGQAGALGVVSGASGAEPATREERSFLAGLEAAGHWLAVRGIGGAIGHGMEAQFPAGVALAALALSRGGFYPPFEDSGIEAPLETPPRRILVTSFGHWRGEGLALLEAAG